MAKKIEWSLLNNRVEQLILNNEKTVSFPLKEYWLDIGKLEDFKKANIDYQTLF